MSLAWTEKRGLLKYLNDSFTYLVRMTNKGGESSMVTDDLPKEHMYLEAFSSYKTGIQFGGFVNLYSAINLQNEVGFVVLIWQDDSWYYNYHGFIFIASHLFKVPNLK